MALEALTVLKALATQAGLVALKLIDLNDSEHFDADSPA